ncbi:phenylalanine--tRNA ligase subunit beta [archaeon]|nr:phenylalanine--tRNA ligase subunit beta [archaeon]
MPTITASKQALEKYIGKKLSLEELKDRISMLGTDLESIENDEVNVEIFPDRPDMLSAEGLGRALSSFVGVNTGLKKYELKKSGEKVIIEDSVKNVRPYTACAIVKNLKFDDEKIKQIIQLQEKLHVTYGKNRKRAAIGVYPMEKIKFPIYFRALKPEDIKFVPLESEKEMNGRQILSSHPAGRDYAHLLEGKDKFPIFIDANNEILSMPPIINSHNTGKITEETKEVFIECSGFDFNVLKKTLNIIVTSLADMGGEIYSMELDYGKKEITPDLKPEEMKLDENYVNKLLGLDLSKSDIKKYLERMGFGYDKKVLIPSYRADIMHQCDIAEDIAISYGYENFKEEIPNVSTLAEEDKIEIFKRKVSGILIGFGLLETNTYNLVNEDLVNKNMGLDNELVKVKNPVNIEYNSLRSWMIPSLLKVLQDNRNYDYPQNLFEIGEVFKKGDTETGVEEFTRVGIVKCHNNSNFTEVKQILEGFLQSLGLKYELKEVEHNSFIAGRVGRIIVNDAKVGYIGEIHPKVLVKFGLEMPVAAMELNLSELFKIV